jgi:hypothetical protein
MRATTERGKFKWHQDKWSWKTAWEVLGLKVYGHGKVSKTCWMKSNKFIFSFFCFNNCVKHLERCNPNFSDNFLIKMRCHFFLNALLYCDFFWQRKIQALLLIVFVLFCFYSTGVWTQDLYLEPLHCLFIVIFFQDRKSLAIWLSWLRTASPPP